MVALLCSWHEHNQVVATALEAKLDGGAVLLLAAPALIECYAVLTRLPAPRRFSAQDALSLIETNFRKVRTIALSAADYWSFVAQAPVDGVYGGRTYDAVIAACARKEGANALWTLNSRHFEQFAAADLQIFSPIE